jgi:hypothetical protein
LEVRQFVGSLFEAEEVEVEDYDSKPANSMEEAYWIRQSSQQF